MVLGGQFLTAYSEGADTLTVGELVKMCKAKNPPEMEGKCVGTVEAVYIFAPKGLFCVPPLPKADDLISAFVEWAETHKSTWNWPANDGVVEALASKYPC
jgi:hypothetical protein